MAKVSDDVRAFFVEFERNSTELDMDAIGAQFASVFLSADPERVVSVPKAAFLAALPKRQEMFASAGVTRIRLAAVHETALDALHTMARTDWIAEFNSGDEVLLGSTFILRREGPSLVVVFYLNHQDISQLMAARSQPNPANP